MAETKETKRMKSKDLFTGVFQQDIDNISKTWENFDKAAFEAAVRTIGKAKHIYIVALRESFILGEYLRMSLNRIFPDVKLISSTCSSEIPEQLLHLTDKDVVIGISFPNYSKLTLEAMEFANQRNAQIITLTDDEHGPVTMYSSCNLYAGSAFSTVAASLTAAMSYINALIAALYMKHEKTALQNMETLNTFWEEYSSDGPDEMNPLSDTIEYDNPELRS